MAWLDSIRWRGVGNTYTLPWLKHRVECSADPAKIAEYAKGEFTRSRMLQKLLTQFHLSKDSIVVSSDAHAAFLKKYFYKHLPSEAAYPAMATKVVETVFVSDGQQRTIPLSSHLIRATYTALLENVLGIEISDPLAERIKALNLRPYWRPLHIEGLMYAVGLHLPVFLPLRALFDAVFYRRLRSTRHRARKLEKTIVRFSPPREGTWYAALLELQREGHLTKSQVRGEIRSMLVSAFTVSAAASSMLLCLAARPEYVRKIAEAPELARAFVNEVLRLYPPFRQFGYERKPFADNGVFPLSDTTDFLIATFALHRNAEVWERANQFLPERFLDCTAMRGFKYLPFGMSERVCPGKSFSMSLLTEILRVVCAEGAKLTFGLPADYRAAQDGMPVATAGRLVSFPVDDRLNYRRAGTAGQPFIASAETRGCPFHRNRATT